MESSYIPLHVMSEYSIGESTARISELIGKAESLNMKALALTDTTLSGSLEFYRECLKHELKPILGQKVIFNDSYLILLCKDFEAYKILCKYSIELLKREGNRAELPFTKEECTHLICITPQFDSQYVLQNFGTNLYLEIQYSTLKQINPFKVLSAHKKLPAVITNPVCFIEKEDNTVLNALKDYREENFTECNPDHYFVSEDEIKPFLENEHLELLENTNKIAEKISYIFPENYFEENECIKRMAENLPLPPECNGTITAEDFLRLKVEENLPKRFETITVEIQERVHYELDDIISRHFEKYFLLHWKIIEQCDKLGILYASPWGTATSSLIGYVLGITEVNPIEYGLIYDHFLNPKKPSYPDFDIPIEKDRYEELLKQLKVQYSDELIVQVSSLERINEHLAIEIAGKYSGFSDNLIKFLKRLNPEAFGLDKEVMLSLLNNYPESRYYCMLKTYDEVLRYNELSTSNRYEEFAVLAEKLYDLLYTRDLEFPSFIIAKKDVQNILPICSDNQGLYTQYHKFNLADYGFYKADISGSTPLTKIAKILRKINKDYAELQRCDCQLFDYKTHRLLNRIDVEGVYIFQNYAIRCLLRKHTPDSFLDLFGLYMLYQLDNGIFNSVFYDHKSNVNKSSPFPERYTDILNETFGFIASQEQVIKLISRITSCSLADADLLRIDMSRERYDNFSLEKNQFIKQAIKNGISENEASIMFDILVPYTLFARSTAECISDIKLALQDAYLKAHYPKEYLEVCRKEYNEEAEVDDEDY